ncbi:MAG: helix-turn-helix domain-containing protein [Chloroflexota bacterium]
MNVDENAAEQKAEAPVAHSAHEKQGAQIEYRRALLGARLGAGLTQKRLAERAGMKQSVVARLEAGGRVPTLETMQRLAAALGVDFVITASGTVETHRPKTG